ncbi:SusD/RagB family nutrient-binding outer membrane lipoprotein [Mesonia ostreae]|uniref:SusD/RagB family nutrient-binding outer membrane lipoprotein n=1 Tax=Mesonia ostreae TaxID=861110 RepID=A0ABU2KLH6_9FLAO|nr:SusD/RagB family nutrient-binding outer membrane lipoprotein [Mesonia ostreae]MDT0295529.1 SusD/RagB family nutrient-binding outer membrane lipoprotein [Mesonia ostreae]
MKKISILNIILIASLTLTSCSEDYLDINTSPTNPSSETVTPDLTLAGALTTPNDNADINGRFSPLSANANELGAIFMSNWASNVNSFAGGYSDEFRLTLTNSFHASIWDNTYEGLATTQAIIDYDSDNYDNHKAIARINKTFYFQYLVDLYGDIPYFEALQRGDNYYPTYDDAQTIYRDLIDQLDLAITEINDANSEDVSVGAEDVVFNGDLSRWIQFANTLKLRILLRQSEMADGETASYLSSQFQNLENNFLLSDSFINPGYTNSQGKQNPFYEIFAFDANGTPAQNLNSIVGADYAVEFLKGNQPNNPNLSETIATGIFDSRVERIYKPLAENNPAIPTPGEVIGVVQGYNSSQAPDFLSNLGEGLLKDSSQNLYLITAAESYFLQSEAVLKGYVSGDAKSLFEQGIRSSFDILGIPEDADSYIQNSNNSNLIGWDGSANKLEAIMTQKWIALNGFNGIESWIEYTRTGYPQVPLATIAQQNSKPVRLLYPSSEYSSNAANVPNQSQNAAFDTPIFWGVN